jgi:phenylalanyl-tRNA synthetase beta chain
VSPRHVETFRLRRDVTSISAEPDPVAAPVIVTNPLSRDHSVLRNGLIGSLLDVVADNIRHGRTDVPIFEVGKGYGRAGSETREWWRLGFALSGSAEPPAWNRPARSFDLDDAKGLVELVCRRLGFAPPAYETDADEPLFHPGRTARVTAHCRGTESEAAETLAVAGIVGELHPDLLERWETRAERVIVAELAVAGLAGGQLDAVRSSPPARHPAVERDLAIVVAESRPAAEVGAVIRRSGGPLLQGVVLFDIYRGSPLAPDEKSLAHRLTFAAPDRTLTESEVDAAVAAVSEAISNEIGGRLRT